MHKEYESVQNYEGYIKVIRTELVHNCAESKQNEQTKLQKNFSGSISKETPRTELVQNWAESEQNEENSLKICNIEPKTNNISLTHRKVEGP